MKMKKGKCYLFTYDEERYEGIVLCDDVEYPSGVGTTKLYARILGSDDVCQFTLQFFPDSKIEDVEEIENLHFFNTDEMVEMFLSLRGSLKFLGWNHVRNRHVREFNYMYNNTINEEEELFFENDGRFLCVKVHYNTVDTLRTAEFNYYYISVVGEKDVVQLETWNPVNTIVRPEKLMKNKYYGLPHGIRLGDYVLYDVEDGDVMSYGNGFRGLNK